MRGPVVLMLILACSGVFGAAKHEGFFGNSTDLIGALSKRIADLQVPKFRPYIPGLEWEKQAGVYKSVVKIYAHGSEDLAIFRDLFAVFDNNMFVTAWVTSCLLETARFAHAPAPSHDQLALALKAMATYRDHNRHTNTSLATFWPQSYNKTVKAWQSKPANLVSLFKLARFLPVNLLEKFLEALGMKDLAEELKDIWEEKNTLIDAFRIPADFDDTFVNIGVGALLQQMKASFPEAHASWMRDNPEVSSVLAALKQYAYRPMSSDPDVNTIDPRTYFYLRHFLEGVKARGEDLALVPTWTQNLGDIQVQFHKGVAMPFNINNVDVTVSANFIFGITSGVLTGLLSPSILDDPDLRQIYLNTTAMIVDQINTDFSQRRDLALTYYPSAFEFYWFVARSYSMLQEYSASGKLPHPALQRSRAMLGPALRAAMTRAVLKKAQTSGQDMVFFDDFLGDADRDFHNRSLNHAEDRIFTTAMAANALLSTWTVYDRTSQKLRWTKDCPSEVRGTVQKAVKWLRVYSVDMGYRPWNAFFSGSVKGMDSLPFWYPANRLQFLNGTRMPEDPNLLRSAVLIGFQGIVSKEQYDVMLTQPHFGVKTPETFPGYNKMGNSFFPFWCSEAYTYAVTLLALVKYDHLTV